MPDGSTDSVFLDASPAQQHVTTAQVTDHQVEEGPSVVDYIRPMPKRVTINGVVTNTPIAAPRDHAGGATAQQKSSQYNVGGATFGTSALTFSASFNRVVEVFGDLVLATLGGAIWTVTTQLQVYRNMAATNFAVPVNAQSGSAINFTIDFQEIRIVTTSTTTIPVKTQKVSRGQQPPTDATDEEKTATKKSAAAAFVDFVRGG